MTVAAGLSKGSVEKIAVVVSILAILGPYIYGSVRLEHVVIYGFALLITARLALARNTSLTAPDLWTYSNLLMPIIWLGILTLSLLGHLLEFGTSLPDLPSFLSGIDSFLLPITGYFLVQVLASSAGKARAAVYVGTSIVIIMVVNALLAVATASLGRPSALEWFAVSRSDESVSVASLSPAQNLGVFNQPAEAGLAYSLAVLCVIFFFVDRPGVQFALVAILSVGGFISISKVFVIGGVVIIILAAGIAGGVKRFLTSLGGLLLGFLASIPLSGFGTYGRLFSALTNTETQEDALWVLTAGRRGTSGEAVNLSSTQEIPEPFWGFGPSGINGAGLTLDSAYLHMVTIGGHIGFALWLLVLCLLLIFSIRSKDSAWRIFGLALFCLVVGSSLGFEPLSSNRSGTMAMMLIALIMCPARDHMREPRMSPSRQEFPSKGSRKPRNES